MFISYEVTKADSVLAIAAIWGDEWGRYLDAIIRGFTFEARGIETQLKKVCSREHLLEPKIGFAFRIHRKTVSVGIFLGIGELDRFLNLYPASDWWLCINHILETKEELENDAEWEEVAEGRARSAASYLATDLARDGLPAEMKRRIALIVQFFRLFNQSSTALKWREV